MIWERGAEKLDEVTLSSHSCESEGAAHPVTAPGVLPPPAAPGKVLSKSLGVRASLSSPKQMGVSKWAPEQTRELVSASPEE